jgi:hypothetical protein
MEGVAGEKRRGLMDSQACGKRWKFGSELWGNSGLCQECSTWNNFGAAFSRRGFTTISFTIVPRRTLRNLDRRNPFSETCSSLFHVEQFSANGDNLH